MAWLIEEQCLFLADIEEMYSLPRIRSVAEAAGLDLTTTDEEGKPWDVFDPRQRNKALRRWRDDKPLIAIVTPMCAAFSAARNQKRCRIK